ncbi:helix-turn-helix domain-containing protein [Pseudonocardia sp. EV170527-09]|uniref:helix-turn-helix domain-containing protein n=1 Tax=Pseudonocardia sp. EV170527-09 TaxID=2603411 RepID=UPI0011F20CCC|nr:helix-turn-helix domain-containing protein [Pseudonocardia sp. EV170527-09]KAA1033956.1 helix-turn-helix domain-containing protein [Pseudonocardia sp. EV170527-09]
MPEFTAETLPARQLYRVSEAMLLLSLSRSVIYELIRSGRLGSVTEGRTRLVPATAIAAYIELLTAEAKEASYGKSA